MVTNEDLTRLVGEVTPLALDLRRRLHACPEPSYREHETTRLIAEALTANGIAHNLRTPETGLWLDIGNEPLVAFRADLDALPIEEPAGNEPVSANPGWMHACGHDAHAAIALGITLVLRRLSVRDGVRMFFQPAEEAFPGGATDFVAEGLVTGLKSIIAFHVDPTLETGLVGVRSGPITASADSFALLITGPGGHTARPHRTVDLIAEAARVVTDLPVVLRRSVDARSPMAVAFGAVHGGRSANVIPTTVELKGTVRTLDPALWESLPLLMQTSLSSILDRSGADFSLEYVQAIPPVVNDQDVIATVSAGIGSLLGESSLTTTQPSMGGEDFANYLSEVPGALLRLGTSGQGHDLHSPSFLLDEDTVPHGIKAGVAAILSLLERV